MADLPAGAAARNRAVGISINGKGYVGTGWNDSLNTYYSSWWEYNPVYNLWTQKADFTSAPTPGTARNRSCAFSIGGKGYVSMGQDGATIYAGLFEYDPATNAWANKTSFAGAVRYSSVAFAIGTKGYIGTGYDNSSYYKDLWEWSSSTNTWTQKASMPTAAPARYSAVGFSVGSFGYVGTGYAGVITGYLDDLWQYDPSTNSWLQKSNFPGNPRAVSFEFTIGINGYVGGGFDGSNTLADMWVYNSLDDTWSQQLDFAGGARCGASAFSLNGSGYVATGSTQQDFGVKKDLWKFTPAVSATLFQKTYGGTNDDTDPVRMSYASPTNDGGYIIASSTKSFGMGVYDIYLIKTNQDGDTMWTKTYGSNISTTDDFAASVRQTNDGGYIISGAAGAPASSDMLIVKTLSNGSVQWTRTMGGTGVERANYAEEIATGGGFIITGRMNVSSLNGAGIMKLSSFGNIVSGSKAYGGSGAGDVSEGFSIQQLQGGDILIGGEIKPNLATSDAFLVVANSSGATTISSVRLNSGAEDVRGIIRQAPDGGFIFCGSTGTIPNTDIYLIKRNSAGAILWSKSYGGPNNDVCRSLTITNAGEYAIAGFTNSFGAGNNDAFLMLVDTDGAVSWSQTYGGTANDMANSLHQTADGGFVLSGESSSFSAGGTDVYVIKTDYQGISGCNEAPASFSLITNQTWVPTAVSQTANITFVSSYSLTPKSTQTLPASLCTFCTFPIGISSQDVTCFGDCDGDAFVGASGGTQPYSYLWSTGDTTDFIDSLCAGGYTVTVTDAAGCTAVDSIYISEPSQIVVNLLSLADTICAGDSIFIGSNPSGGTAPYYFFWYPPSGLACDTCQFTNASPSSDTIYSLDVYDDNGCFAEDSMTITVGPQASVSAGADTIICGGQSVTLSATGGNSYSWSPSIGLNCTSCANPIATPISTVTYTVVGANTFGCSDAASVTVTVISSPTVNITPGSTTFCSGGGVTLVANSNGTSYSWSTGASTASIPAFPSSTTTYSVTVSNGTCTSTDTAVITINPRPFPVMTTGNITCNGVCDGASTAAPSAGTAPFSYFWSPGGQTTSSATGLCPGVYTAIITDANGCSANGKDTITQPAVLAAAVTPNNAGCVCSGSASVVASGGTAPYFYSWSSGGSASAVSNLCGGNYSVAVTDNNGCVTIKSFIINQLPPVVVSVSPNITICSGNTTTIGANVSGAANITYFWMPGNLTTDTISVSPTSNTTYTIIASDSVSNCSDTNSVSVSVTQTPLASIIGNTTICSGQTTALSSATTSGVNYVWNTGATTSSITVNPTITTAYSLTVVASGNNSCSDSDSITVTVSSSPVVSVASVYDTICFGLSSTTLTAGGGTSYTWFPGSLANDTVIVSPDVTTTYTVLVTNSAGCSSVAAYTIVVQGGFGTPVVNPVSVSYCKGDSILPFIASPPPSVIVVWFDTSGTLLDTGVVFYPPQNLPFGTTNYLVVQGISDACVSYPTVLTITVNPPPMVSAGPDITICPGHTANLQASGGINYLWSPSDYLNDPAVFNPSSNPDSAITYVVLVTDAKGCKNKDTVAVIVATNDTCGIHIYNVITPNGDGDNDVFFIDGINLFPENFVEIFNRWGSSVWHGKNYDNRKVVWRGQNEAGQPLPAGTYYYVIDVKGLGRFTGWVELLR